MDSAVIHTRLTDDKLDITTHECPRKLFESLNLELKGSGRTLWKTIDEAGFHITFFAEERYT